MLPRADQLACSNVDRLNGCESEVFAYLRCASEDGGGGVGGYAIGIIKAEEEFFKVGGSIWGGGMTKAASAGLERRQRRRAGGKTSASGTRLSPPRWQKPPSPLPLTLT